MVEHPDLKRAVVHELLRFLLVPQQMRGFECDPCQPKSGEQSAPDAIEQARN
jgi:hypothetical protein